jgi:hypothetical protein
MDDDEIQSLNISSLSHEDAQAEEQRLDPAFAARMAAITLHGNPTQGKKHPVEDAINPTFTMKRQQKAFVADIFGPALRAMIHKPAAEKTVEELENILRALGQILRMDHYEHEHALEIARVATITQYPANIILQRV